jgi:tetratricopeptide (TPR) repeat protein
MTPVEAAIRLFNRVMMADEQGNADEVAQFAPMAIAAYERVENLDLQAVYHIGLISAASGDPEKAWEAVERMRAVVPDHLLASLLEHRLATDESDQAKAEQAIARFKAAYDEEIKVDRAEYQGHQRQIDLFRQTLGAAAGNG